MKQRAHPNGPTLIKVLSDTDDAVTLAIKRADKREKRERKKQLEYRSKARLQERDFVRGNWFAETQVSLPPPTIRKGFRDRLTDNDVAVSATLALNYIKEERGGLGGEGAGRVPDLNSIKSVRRKQSIKKRISSKLQDISNVSR